MIQSQSFADALNYAADFAVSNGQNIIDVSTMALGILEAPSPFQEIFSKEERNKIREALISKTGDLGTHDLETATVPLTVTAGLLIKFGQQYAAEVGDGEVDVYHIMLALFSYPNETAAIFSRQGWIFENYLDAINKIVSPPIEVDRLEMDMQPSVTQPYPKLRKALWAEDYKRGIAEKLVHEADRHATFGKFATCRMLCDIALDITTEDINPYRLIIYCLNNERKYREAVDLYNKWGIDDDLMKMNVGICYRELGAHEKALEIFRSFPEITADLHNLMGYSLCSLKQYDDSLREYDEAIAMKPDYAFAWNNKGYALLNLGHIQEAKTCIAQSLSLDKGNAFAYRNMTLVNIEEKNKSEALANIEKALFFRYRDRFGDDIDKVISTVNAL